MNEPNVKRVREGQHRCSRRRRISNKKGLTERHEDKVANEPRYRDILPAVLQLSPPKSHFIHSTDIEKDHHLFPFFFLILLETQLQHSYTGRWSACGIEWIEIDKKMFLYGRINGTDRIAASRVYNATRTRHRSAPRITTRVAGTSPSLLRLLCLLRLRVFRCFIMNFMTFSFFFSSSISCFSHYFFSFYLNPLIFFAISRGASLVTVKSAAAAPAEAQRVGLRRNALSNAAPKKKTHMYTSVLPHKCPPQTVFMKANGWIERLDWWAGWTTDWRYIDIQRYLNTPLFPLCQIFS